MKRNKPYIIFPVARTVKEEILEYINVLENATHLDFISVSDPLVCSHL